MKRAIIIIEDQRITVRVITKERFDDEPFPSSSNYAFALAANWLYLKHGNTPYIITDARTLKPVPDPEENRVDLEKAA